MLKLETPPVPRIVPVTGINGGRRGPGPPPFVFSGKKDLRYKVFLSRRVCVVLQYCKHSRQYCHSCPDAFLQFGQISPLPYTEPAQPVRGYSLIRDVQSHHTAILHEIPLLTAVPHMHTISQYGEVIILGYCITALSVLLYWGILEKKTEAPRVPPPPPPRRHPTRPFSSALSYGARLSRRRILNLLGVALQPVGVGRNS